jgi:hypothetical protein
MNAVVSMRRFRQGERQARKQGKPRGSKPDTYKSFFLGINEATNSIYAYEMTETFAAKQ